MKKYILIMMLVIISTSCKQQNTKLITVEVSFVDEVILDFSYENLKTVLYSSKVKYPDIVLRQAIHETGYFTSNIFYENNNLFGMKMPYIRNTTAIGINRGHAIYSNWRDCIYDMVLFQEYYDFLISESDDYYDFLDEIYAEDPNYCWKLKNIEL